MKLFGLSGGIGMGKSTSARLLSEQGVSVIDTDILARQIVEPGQPALAEIKTEFGAQIISSTGELRRDELARKVFSDAAALRKLESILHPRIRELWQAETKTWREQGRDFGAVIIPLLFETNAESEFDAIICVACSAETQRMRLRERGWSDEQIQQRLASQWPVEKKIAQSDFVIWTDTTLEAHAAQLERILRDKDGL
jgi:dephospho-CoA kinase